MKLQIGYYEVEVTARNIILDEDQTDDFLNMIAVQAIGNRKYNNMMMKIAENEYELQGNMWYYKTQSKEAEIVKKNIYDVLKAKGVYDE